MASAVVRPFPAVQIIQHFVDSDGLNPNCSVLGKPLLIYKNALDLGSLAEPAGVIERLFHSNGFPPHWRAGMFRESHYHSTTHEILAVFQGRAVCEFGGPVKGIELVMEVGDVLIVPAGLAHRAIQEEAGFQMVGAYPLGCEWDMCYGISHDECSKKCSAISKVKPLTRDPVWGQGGPVMSYWNWSG